jgi:exodeoxyribonuclease VII small subunit
MAGSKKEKSSFEESFKKLESIVEDLEKGESTLEESMKRFEEGMELIHVCTKILNDAEARLQKLVRGEDGGFQLELNE